MNTTPFPLGELLTEDEIADYLKVDKRTLKLWRKHNVGPLWTKPGGSIRYPAAWLEKYLNDRAGAFDSPDYAALEAKALEAKD